MLQQSLYTFNIDVEFVRNVILNLIISYSGLKFNIWYDCCHHVVHSRFWSDVVKASHYVMGLCIQTK